MANQVAARLAGDDYQHLYAWQFVLELKMPHKNVRLVTIEDARAGSVDDVTVQYEPGTSMPSRFYQVKYHVDQRGAYSTDELIAHEPGEASLLEKFWRSWKLLNGQEPGRAIELYLVSNWSWDVNDKLRSCINGHDTGLTDVFFTATPLSDIGKLRRRWQNALQAPDQDFEAFMRCLRFNLGFDCGEELAQRVAERMEWLGLKSGIPDLLVAVGIVRNWIKSKRQQIDLAELEAALEAHDLYRPKEAERCVSIYLTTIKEQKFEIEPDYILDWRDQFIGNPNKKGHQLTDPSAWNDRLLPDLEALEARVNQETDCRLVRARGLARLSAWFAFGFTFSEVARYTIEVDQRGQLWRTDAKPSPDFRLMITSETGSLDGERLDGEGATVAVGISVTGSLDEDVRRALQERTEQVSALLLLRPARELGATCFQSAGDVAAFADKVKEVVRPFVKKWQAKRILLFYFGPLSGACFLGHKLNAVCQEIQVMEDQQPGYAPSFLLR